MRDIKDEKEDRGSIADFHWMYVTNFGDYLNWKVEEIVGEFTNWEPAVKWPNATLYLTVLRCSTKKKAIKYCILSTYRVQTRVRKLEDVRYSDVLLSLKYENKCIATLFLSANTCSKIESVDIDYKCLTVLNAM